MLAVCLVAPSPAAETAQEIHGENSVFAGQGVAIAWGVLKGADEAQTQVVVRIAQAGAAYAYVRIEGVDPFTQTRQEILAGQPLGPQMDLRSPRATFADFPRREIHFFTTNDWHARRPTLTVYYMGVPDTAPEFTAEAALFTYLSDALAKVRRTGHGRTP